MAGAAARTRRAEATAEDRSGGLIWRRSRSRGDRRSRSGKSVRRDGFTRTRPFQVDALKPRMDRAMTPEPMLPDLRISADQGDAQARFRRSISGLRSRLPSDPPRKNNHSPGLAGARNAGADHISARAARPLSQAMLTGEPLCRLRVQGPCRGSRPASSTSSISSKDQQTARRSCCCMAGRTTPRHGTELRPVSPKPASGRSRRWRAASAARGSSRPIHRAPAMPRCWRWT